LDCNGTARIQGNATLAGTSNVSSGLFSITGSGGNNQQLLIAATTWSLTVNNAQSIVINAPTINPSSGGFYYAAFDFTAATINATGTYSGNLHGVRVSPSTINVANGNYYGVFTNANAATNVWNFYGNGTAQNYFGGAVSIGVTTANASAILQADSTTRGFLPPRMTTAQKNLIAAPANGLVIYDTTLAKLCVFTGVNWETVTSV
jgi:hypothetical protein